MCKKIKMDLTKFLKKNLLITNNRVNNNNQNNLNNKHHTITFQLNNN